MILIIINTVLGLIAVNFQYRMRLTIQKQYQEQQLENTLRYEYDQWNTEKKIIESEQKIEIFAKEELGMIPIKNYAATITIK